MKKFFKIIGIILIIIGVLINFIGLTSVGDSYSDSGSTGAITAMIEGGILLFLGIGLYIRNKKNNL